MSVQVSGTAADSLLASGARLIEDYGAFRLLAGTPEQLANVPSDAPFEVRATDHLIQLNARHLDTSSMRVNQRALSASLPGQSLHLIQFIGPSRPEWLQDLRATGARVVSYVPTNGYLVYADPPSLQRLLDRAGTAREIRWNGSYLPEYKAPPSAFTHRGEYSVQLVEDPASNDATLALARSFPNQPLRTSRALGYVNFVVDSGASAIDALARRPDVVSIIPYEKPRLLDERQDIIVARQLNGSTMTGPVTCSGSRRRDLPKSSSMRRDSASTFPTAVSTMGPVAP